MEDIPTSPNDTVSPLGASVRRVHTISSSMRGRRPPISEEHPEYYNEDDRADEPWNAAPGAIGDGKGALLHRQASLPTKYHRGFRSNRTGTQSGTLSPSGRNVSGLSVIAADHAGEGEEEWEQDMRDLRGDESNFPRLTMIYIPSILTTILESPSQHGEGTLSPLSGGNPYFQPTHSRSQSQTSNNGGGLSPGPYAPQPSISPPPASNIRRHTSLTANAAAGAAGRRRLAQRRAAQSPSPPSPAYADNDHGHSPLSPIGRTPWGPATPPIATANREWRPEPSIDDVQRQLGNMELAPPSQNLEISTSPTPHRLSPGPNHPPRFRANSPQPGVPQQGQQQIGSQVGFNGAGGRHMAKLQLITDLTPPAVPPKQPQSAAAAVPPIGHGIPQARRWHGRPGEQGGYNDNGNAQRQDEKPFTASGVVWDQKDRIIGARSGNNGFDASGAPPVPPLPQGYAGMMQPGMNFGGMNMGGLDTASLARFGMGMGMMSPGGVGNMNTGLGQGRLQVNTAVGGASQGMNNSTVGSGNGGTSPGGYLSPVDIPSLIVSKGYNPASFDIRPQFARYFVIKSYTEDDVHKSLKYEIWSSTDPGNKRLDKAFKESSGQGPIYLFFSVNASGHFCGMAEMLTPVDYTRSSTVWAQDKWKGVFKVRWIFVRDIPNAALRHIRLNNTQERKPVTNSRDTQELLPEAGHEMLRICFTHPARTSLLQDFAFYELQSIQKISAAPSPQAAQHPFAMPNPSTLPPGQQQQLALQQQQLQLQMLQMQNQYQQQQQQMGMSRSPGPPSPYPGGLGNHHHNGNNF